MDAGEREDLLRRAYRLFNERRVDDLLAMMTDDVEWPDVANGAVLRGQEAVRPYWEAQFAVADPRVEPTGFVEAGDDLVAVVDQRVFDLRGQLLSPPAIVYHRYAFAGDLVRRMAAFPGRDEALAAP